MMEKSQKKLPAKKKEAKPTPAAFVVIRKQKQFQRKTTHGMKEK